MEALHNGGGLSLAFVTKKFLCFGDNGVNAFQGTKISVTKQINTNNAPLSFITWLIDAILHSRPYIAWE